MRQPFARAILGSLFLVTMLGLGGCATAQKPADDDQVSEVSDPLESVNRQVFDFNIYLDDHVLAPVATAYRDTIPLGIRTGIHNVLGNVTEPYTMGNDLLQLQMQRFGEEFARMFMNTLMGFGGVFDVGAMYGLPGHRADFGQTLGTYGLPGGPFLMLPFFGPSNPRDLAGAVADAYGDPVSRIVNGEGFDAINYVRSGTDLVDQRSRTIDQVQDLRKNSLDFYATVRSLSVQRRQAQIDHTD